ncbi:AAA family ATPase [Paenibacillus beijingensis]|uniref:Tunicamycin resistance protein n=1 Tax=Paenibacillus beijingensis TaxID=1126833 RepID=A0A0D5NLI7_9BACL|nr:AAA family ATPase [Paenibacillus beijingensis]AJY76184.1 Tunicamycin resistance protein [Paenibacillus beijingensis]
MILWINGAFGSGKTTIAYELKKRIPNSFVYDPENAGYFIRKNAPKQILKDDFQEHGIWREINFSILETINNEFPGIIIVPMTIVNPQYFHEIINKLRSNGVEVNHFTLLANRETLIKRLRSRGDNKNSWPAKQIDRCISSLSQDIFEIHIHTDNLTPEEILDRIAKEANIQLQPDNRGIIKKKIDRLVVQIKHIRI